MMTKDEWVQHVRNKQGEGDGNFQRISEVTEKIEQDNYPVYDYVLGSCKDLKKHTLIVNAYEQEFYIFHLLFGTFLSSTFFPQMVVEFL